MNFIQRAAFKLLSKSISLTDATTFTKMFREWIGNIAGETSKNTGYIASCVDVYGKAFAKVDFKLYDQEDGAEVENHPILDIFNRPNSWQTMWEIKYRMASDFTFIQTG